MPLGDAFAKLGIRARTKEKIDPALSSRPLEARDPQEQAALDYAPLAGLLGNALHSAYTLPQRIFASSEERRLGGDYNPAPVVELLGNLYGLNAPFSPGIGAFGAGRRLGSIDFENLLRKGRSTEAQTPAIGPETVKWAAVKDNKGNVYEGAIHRDAKIAASEARGLTYPPTEDLGLQTGFTTSKGRFVPREEAAQIAEAAGQVRPGYVRSALDAADFSTPDQPGSLKRFLDNLLKK